MSKRRDYIASKFPTEEQKSIHHLNEHLRELSRYSHEVKNDLAIFDARTLEMEAVRKADPSLNRAAFTEILRINRDRVKAAQNSAESVYHFAHIFEAAKALAHSIKTISAEIDREKLKGATKLLYGHFPNFDARNAIAHAAEERIKAQKERKPFYEDNLDGRTLIHSQDGKIVTFELSQATLEKLLEVEDALYSALPPDK